MVTSVAGSKVTSNMGEENFSSHEDPNANPPFPKTYNSTKLSKDAIDQKLGAETKVPLLLKIPLQGIEIGFVKQDI